jgi:hypothetical protein
MLETHKRQDISIVVRGCKILLNDALVDDLKLCSDIVQENT